MHKLSLRQQSIVDKVHLQEYCSIDDLARCFDVTTQTIRRDINELCRLGLACRHHGGVGLPAMLANRSYVSRQTTNKDEKLSIAKQVAQDIPNGSTIFLGIGTTIAMIAEQLVTHQELRVVTNNFEAAHVLSQCEHIETWVPGGRVRTNDRDVVGDHVVPFFDQFSADIGIVSCASIRAVDVSAASLSNTVMTTSGQQQDYAFEHELREAAVSQQIIAGAREKWLVANSSKWQGKANAKIASLSYFDRIFRGEHSAQLKPAMSLNTDNLTYS
ncbi:DeoR/GlpR family DNA-binding transcription regulator [Vibrio methylphosphonaticus]|uniref:DeoR/GlpR family DNA-binding transcription regulator n=1 Tax=Vibrio methylphosphonaticus TaxID=2946866 RepID=UPI00202A7494|nr:DeoR/GlpR family DNA-binding transcription regulator [Vibrio methylphosphonaticus]MCL9774254.1 DeoR/GlpR family DNA-binding transcription regulator [Vibrio methylphosphonaticus]